VHLQQRPGTFVQIATSIIKSNRAPYRSFIVFLREHASTSGLHGLNLRLAPRETAEARGQVGAIEERARLRADRAQGRARLAANGAAELGAAERAVLLGLDAVGSERVRERTGGRGGVNARRVVDSLCYTVLVGSDIGRAGWWGATYEARSACPRTGSGESGRRYGERR
jgi:hypothetical protein